MVNPMLWLRRIAIVIVVVASAYALPALAYFTWAWLRLKPSAWGTSLAAGVFLLFLAARTPEECAGGSFPDNFLSPKSPGRIARDALGIPHRR
jgi:hypothetical protein